MSNWLEEEKERKKLKEIEEQEEGIRKERIATQIKRFKEQISPFYSYVNKVKDEDFPIKVVEYSSGEFEFNNGSEECYRSMKIKPSVNNSFFVSIVGTYNRHGYTYDSPIVEKISYEDHSYTRETRKEKYVNDDYQKEIVSIECEEDELIRFLNDEANALKIIGWLFDKTKLHTRWFPGIIPAELVYKKGIKDAKEEYYSRKVKTIGGWAIVGGIVGLVIGLIIYSIFNSGAALFWTIIIFMAIFAWTNSSSVYHLTGVTYEEDPKKFNFEF